MHPSVSCGEYQLSSDRRRLDVAGIHAFLATSYWSPGIPLRTVQRAIDGSLCFGVYHLSAQVGFARVVTDTATFAYLADVFILPAHRGRGLSKALMTFIMAHPDLQGLRRFMLATNDAHGLYRQFGFTAPRDASRLMELLKPDVYRTVDD